MAVMMDDTVDTALPKDVLVATIDDHAAGALTIVV
jgi:hypothetical protein